MIRIVLAAEDESNKLQATNYKQQATSLKLKDVLCLFRTPGTCTARATLSQPKPAFRPGRGDTPKQAFVLSKTITRLAFSLPAGYRNCPWVQQLTNQPSSSPLFSLHSQLLTRNSQLITRTSNYFRFFTCSLRLGSCSYFLSSLHSQLATRNS
jgi:hypothetical protein